MLTLIYPFCFCINSCYLLILPLLPFPLITPDVHHNGHVWSCQPLTWVIEYDVMGYTISDSVMLHWFWSHTKSIHLCTTHDYYIFGNTHQNNRSYLHYFHLFVWPNHSRPIARWDFFLCGRMTCARMSLKNQSIWSALNHVKMLSPSQTCSNWDFNQSVWSALNHIKMLSPSQTCSNRGFKWAL